MSSQQTLTGETADADDVELPKTLIECPECGDILLRSNRFDHEHNTLQAPDLGNPESEDTEDEGNDDEPEQVGSYYSVTLEYQVTYRFKVPAYSEHEAKDIAKDWQLDARPADSYHVHSETREGKSIMSTDVPDDWDMCGSELLWEALDRASENADAPEQNTEGPE